MLLDIKLFYDFKVYLVLNWLTTVSSTIFKKDLQKYEILFFLSEIFPNTILQMKTRTEMLNKSE